MLSLSLTHSPQQNRAKNDPLMRGGIFKTRKIVAREHTTLDVGPVVDV